MSNGLKVTWEKGSRETIGAKNKKGEFEPRRGKNKGPIIKQTVVKVLSSK